MKVVVPGGSGLVGRALSEHLQNRGHSCLILSRHPDRVIGLAEGVEVEAWDGISVDALRPVLDGADAVVHLMGESIGAGRWTADRKRRILESRTRSSRAVAEAMVAVGSETAVLIQASAVGFYGPGGEDKISEDTPPGDDFLATVCRQWEAASEIVTKAGIRRGVIRTGVVLSAEGGALPRMLVPFRLFAGGPLGTGSQYLSWIHIADQAAAIRFLVESGDASGPFNLTAPHPVTNRQFARELGGVLGRPSSLPTPALTLRLLLGEMSTLLLEGQRVIPQRLVEAGFEFAFPELGPALQDLLA